ncbi:MAG: DNA polymerase [Balneolaceae bacterium]|nr:DNA polymerase [Balneolaceae bacterium]
MDWLNDWVSAMRKVKEMIDQYFRALPGILKYINKTKQFAKEYGYVKTLMGRRRYIPEINSGNWNVRSFAERTAINMPIQGTAADIIKLAMIRYYKSILKNIICRPNAAAGA